MPYLRTSLLCLATVLASACGGEPGTTTDASTTEATTGPGSETEATTVSESTGETEPTTESSATESTGEPTTEDPSESTETTETTADPTTETTETTDDPSETTDGPTTEDPSETDPSESTENSTSETDTGGEPSCGVANGDYGPCDAIIGWAFNGDECVEISGCDCGDDCDLFFDSLDDCALTCAGAGECNTQKFSGEALAEDPFVQGNTCDEVNVCTPDVWMEAVMALFPDQFVCEGNGFPCDGTNKCAVQWAGEVGPELWEQLCAASLVPGVDKVACVIWGP